MNCWLAYWNINLEDLYTCGQCIYTVIQLCIYIIVGKSKSKIGMSISNFVINIFYDVTIIYFILYNIIDIYRYCITPIHFSCKIELYFLQLY